MVQTGHPAMHRHNADKGRTSVTAGHNSLKPAHVLGLSQSALHFLFNRPLVACCGWHLQTAQGYHLALSRAQSPGPALDLDCVLDPESCAEVDQNIKQQLNVAG